ncbi:hypothetical protein LL06_22795 [Hoeflea sp. BAL378]|uniref:nuclear transport factor 2 family protein n=1 Tax=Hoeflea sp. BAL378 TaxID=1547437 RepID=UPI0005137A9B|nr:nuclear transport factor 2 family protein [Hoeflea sp. BAL378]KGF67380.1 hypothetical protein LL06_22795 [Hoeflea sp. BAL378]
MENLPNVIKAYIAAYNAKDVPAMLACLSEDVSFRNIAGGAVTAETSDRQGFAEMAEFGASAFVTRHQQVTNAITVAETTLAEIAYTAVVAFDLPNGWKAGQEIALTGASLFRVENGKITAIVDQS